MDVQVVIHDTVHLIHMSNSNSAGEPKCVTQTWECDLPAALAGPVVLFRNLGVTCHGLRTVKLFECLEMIC